MPPRKKTNKKAFTSIRVIGRKAQDMLARVKQENETQNSIIKRPTIKKDIQVTLVKLSIISVVKATFAILAIIVGAWLIVQLRHKILLLILAMFVATIIDPGVTKLEKYGIPRAVSIIMQYLLAVFILLFLVVQFVPIIAVQVEQIAVTVSEGLQPFLDNPKITLPLLPSESIANRQLARLIETTITNLSLDQATTKLQQAAFNFSDVTEFVRYAAKISGSVGKFFASLAVVLVLAFFSQMEKERIVKWVRSFLPLKYRQYVDIKTEAIHGKIGQWMLGELMLMFSIFLLTLVALVILRMPYALTLALFAGICEFFPAIGPIIAAVPAMLIGGTQKGVLWVPVIACVYYVIQWCENNLLVPLIMRKAVGLSPIAILFAMMVGISFPDTIHPVLGIMLAVPTTTVLAIFLEDWRAHKEDEE